MFDGQIRVADRGQVRFVVDLEVQGEKSIPRNGVGVVGQSKRESEVGSVVGHADKTRGVDAVAVTSSVDASVESGVMADMAMQSERRRGNEVLDSVASLLGA